MSNYYKNNNLEDSNNDNIQQIQFEIDALEKKLFSETQEEEPKKTQLTNQNETELNELDSVKNTNFYNYSVGSELTNYGNNYDNDSNINNEIIITDDNCINETENEKKKKNDENNLKEIEKQNKIEELKLLLKQVDQLREYREKKIGYKSSQLNKCFGPKKKTIKKSNKK